MDLFDEQSIKLILFTAVILWLMYLCRMYFIAKDQSAQLEDVQHKENGADPVDSAAADPASDS